MLMSIGGVAISDLKDVPHWLPEIALWLHQEWIKRAKDNTLGQEPSCPSNLQSDEGDVASISKVRQRFTQTKQKIINAIPDLAREPDMHFSGISRREQSLQAHLGDGPIPKTLIAHNQSRPLGVVSLVKYSFVDGAQESIWLTNLYVVPECRKRGIATRLLKAICDFAQSHNIKQIRLYTHDQRQFYESRGWIWVMQHKIQGERCDVLELLN